MYTIACVGVFVVRMYRVMLVETEKETAFIINNAKHCWTRLFYAYSNCSKVPSITTK